MPKQALMAIGAHADDIELNTGGTLAKYHALGYEIAYVMSTNNFSGEWKRKSPDGSVESSKPPHYEIMPQRKIEAAAAAELFGTTPIHLDHPQRHYTREDGTMAEVRYGCELPKGLDPDIPTILTACDHPPSVQSFADLILEKDPEAVITHGTAANNPEHFATCLLTTLAYRKAQEMGYGGWLLFWPELDVRIYGKLNFQWDTFVDVSKHWDEKMTAIGKHACQMPYPEHLDLPEWGAACGCERAEVFVAIDGTTQPDPHAKFSLEITRNKRQATLSNVKQRSS